MGASFAGRAAAGGERTSAILWWNPGGMSALPEGWNYNIGDQLHRS